MSADPRTLGWLTRALTHEMSAVQQYLAQSVLARLWGDDALAQHLRAAALEELAHAELLMERLLQLGVAPAALTLTPARLGRDVEQLMQADRRLEVDAVRLYQEALLHVRRQRDAASAAVLQDILNREVAHLQEFDRKEALRER